MKRNFDYVLVLAALAGLGASAGRAETASFSPALALIKPARTPNLVPDSTVVGVQPNGTGVVGSGTESNGGTTASAAISGDFGRVSVTTGIVAVPQVGADPGDVRQVVPGDSGQLAWMMWNDFIRINAAATGPLFATAHINLSGTLIATSDGGPSYAQAVSRVFGVAASSNVIPLFGRNGIYADGGQRDEVYDSNFNLVAEPFAGNFSFIMPFTGAGDYNPFSFDVLCVSATLEAPSISSGTAACDGITLSWGGISALRDRSGNLINDWTTSSSSGLNYAVAFSTPTTAPPVDVTVRYFPEGGIAVPEPANWVLLIAGFGLVGAVQRRRRVAAA
jgi:hypothetical protein